MSASRLGSGASVGRADLVRLLAVLPKAEWVAAARCLGFVPVPETSDQGSGQSATRAIQAEGSVSGDASPAYRPADLPDLPFWRIAAEQIRPLDESAADAPAWLARAKPWEGLPLSDPDRPRPVQTELVPGPRQARFMRRHLAAARPAAALDIERLCGQLARRRLPSRLPRLSRPRWPARVDLILDLDLTLRPFWADFWHLQVRLTHLLGQRLRVWHSRDGDPRALIRADRRRPGEPPRGGVRSSI